MVGAASTFGVPAVPICAGASFMWNVPCLLAETSGVPSPLTTKPSVAMAMTTPGASVLTSMISCVKFGHGCVCNASACAGAAMNAIDRVDAAARDRIDERLQVSGHGGARRDRRNAVQQ